MTTPASYHGHDVLHFLLEAKHAFSVDEILRQVNDRFGADARFHSCSAQGMDAEALLAFFLERGKIVPQDGGYVVAGHRMCRHESDSVPV